LGEGKKKGKSPPQVRENLEAHWSNLAIGGVGHSKTLGVVGKPGGKKFCVVGDDSGTKKTAWGERGGLTFFKGAVVNIKSHE